MISSLLCGYYGSYAKNQAEDGELDPDKLGASELGKCDGSGALGSVVKRWKVS